MAAGGSRVHAIDVFSSELLGNKRRTLERGYAHYLPAGLRCSGYPLPALIRGPNRLAVFQGEKGARKAIAREERANPWQAILNHELSVTVKKMVVHPDFAALAQVADHVPVDSGFVFTAGFRVARPQRHVEAAANFFVE